MDRHTSEVHAKYHVLTPTIYHVAYRHGNRFIDKRLFSFMWLKQFRPALKRYRKPELHVV